MEMIPSYHDHGKGCGVGKEIVAIIHQYRRGKEK
jgi:hypothetical protein